MYYLLPKHSYYKDNHAHVYSIIFGICVGMILCRHKIEKEWYIRGVEIIISFLAASINTAQYENNKIKKIYKMNLSRAYSHQIN